MVKWYFVRIFSDKIFYIGLSIIMKMFFIFLGFYYRVL